MVQVLPFLQGHPTFHTCPLHRDKEYVTVISIRVLIHSNKDNSQLQH